MEIDALNSFFEENINNIIFGTSIFISDKTYLNNKLVLVSFNILVFCFLYCS